MRVVEFDALGPVPFASMLLADHGADVVRVVAPERSRRAEAITTPPSNPLLRNRPWLEADLKTTAGVDVARAVVARADVVLEGYRPGVMERLGLGPGDCHEINPTLVYVRVTGWGQDGPLSRRAGHDINYLAITGALHACSEPGGAPRPPMNLLGDFGGGGMLAAFSALAAWVEARSTGKGQVIDVSMVDGVNTLMALAWGLRDSGDYDELAPGRNRFDGGAPHYGTYETRDHRFLAVGASERRFRRELFERVLGSDEDLDASFDPRHWERLRAELAEAIAERSLDEWRERLDGLDVCATPVLPMSDALAHPQQVARGAFVDVDGRVHPRPAPGFRSEAVSIAPPVQTSLGAVLARWPEDRS